MKQAKIFVPKKLKGGAVIGREGEVWYGIKCANFSAPEHRAFKKYVAEACKQFFVADDDSEESDDK